MIGLLETAAGKVPVVSATLRGVDRLGTVKTRLGWGRMSYKVDPGLYAVGTPAQDSPVLVTANYKMSFDALRKHLGGLSAWILVLDTQGINVWCAAGKGTFGTDELVARLASSGLDRIVSHRNLVLPQLGAPGIAMHEVRKRSGFKVIYGPIRSSDLPAFLDAGMKATEEMRRKTFGLRERSELVPIELVLTMKPLAPILPAVFLLSGFRGTGGFWENALASGSYNVLAVLAAVFAGGAFTPLLLPWLPGRAFALKGVWTGVLSMLVLGHLRGFQLGELPDLLEFGAWLLMGAATSAYLAMNFTGSSTYTSLSGVRKEMRTALPLEIGSGIASLLLWIASLIVS